MESQQAYQSAAELLRSRLQCNHVLVDAISGQYLSNDGLVPSVQNARLMDYYEAENLLSHLSKAKDLSGATEKSFRIRKVVPCLVEVDQSSLDGHALDCAKAWLANELDIARQCLENLESFEALLTDEALRAQHDVFNVKARMLATLADALGVQA